MIEQQPPYPQQPAQPYAQGGPVYPAPQQWSGQPVTGPGHDAPPPPPVKSSRTPLIVAAAAVFVVLVLSLGGYAVYDRFVREDSGIAACKAMAEDKQIDGSPKDSDAGDDKMTEAEYREARKIFEDSRYDKIREHGTALVDLLWQVQQMPADNGGALALVGPMGTHVSGLQTACADEGYIVKMDG